jgi:hypothetical protein
VCWLEEERKDKAYQIEKAIERRQGERDKATKIRLVRTAGNIDIERKVTQDILSWISGGVYYHPYAGGYLIFLR